MTVNDILTGFLGKTLNMPPEQIQSTLYKLDEEGNPTDEVADNALDALANAHAEHVKALKGSDAAKVGEQQFKRGIKEGRETLEKMLRETHNVDSQATGIDLVNDIIAAKAKVEFDDDKVKIHPLFLQMERKAKEQIEATRTELEERIAQIESGYKRKAIIGTIQEKALANLAKLRPVLPSDPTVAQTQQRMFTQQFEAYDYESDDRGNTIVMKDGKRLENDHGHPVPFEELSARIAATMFEFQKTDPKGSAGNKGTVTGDNGGNTGGAFKDKADFLEQYGKATGDRAKQLELATAWKAQSGG